MYTSSIRVTVAFDNPTSGVDHDPRISLTDGTNKNQFRIRDTNSYSTEPPCELWGATNQESTTIISDSRVPHQVTFLFSPSTKFGACYTAHDGGYVTAGVFDDQLVLSDGLSLQINRDVAAQTYTFLYFLVEFLY